MDERQIELIDYLRVLWRWKYLILFGTLGVVLLAGLVTALLPKTYRIVATIDAVDLGDANDKEVERLVARLNARGTLQDETGAAPADRRALTAQYKRPFVIELGMDTQSPAEGSKTLERTASQLIDQLNRLMKAEGDDQEAKREAKIRAIRAQIERLRAEEALVRRRIVDMRPGLERLEKGLAEALPRVQDQAGSLVLAYLSDQIAMRANNLRELERRLAVDLPTQLSELEHQAEALGRKAGSVRPARLAVAPEIPSAPVKPRLKLNLAVGFVAGLMGCVLLAFVLDYVAELRRREGGGAVLG